MTGHFMKTPALLALLSLLCIPAYAATPPLPSLITVKRSAPLESPKAASVPKSTPMLRNFTPASVPSGTPIIECRYALDQPDLFGGIADRTTVDAIQPTGMGCRIDMSDGFSSWEWVVDSPNTAYEQLVGFDWYHDAWQRRHHLFFRRVLYPSPTAATGARIASGGIGGGIRVNKSIAGAGTIVPHTRQLKRR